MIEAPHVERVLRLVDELGAPVVQVWGWPGSGRSAVLAALLDREGAVGLAPAELALPGDAVARAVEEGASWLVCHGFPDGAEPQAVLREMAERLPAGRRLVVVTDRRIAVPAVLCGLVTPGDLALTPTEAADLWQEATGQRPGPEEATRLVHQTEGWYRPLLLAAREVAAREPGGGTVPEEVEELAALPSVVDFVRSRVLPEGVERSAARWGADGEPPRLVEALPEARRGTGDPARPVTGGRTARFQLRLLGSPEAHRRTDAGDWERVSFSLRRGFKVLAYLATSSDHRASREELIEEIWSEEDREAIERNFHPTLSRLRRDLRGGAAASEDDLDPLVQREGFYELDPELGWWIDVDEMTRLAERGDVLGSAGRDPEAVEVREAAWRLYRGVLLEGVYDAWAARRREAAQRRHLSVLRELGGAYERLGRSLDATDAYRALLADDPLQERIHVALMRIYSSRGRRDLVRRQYERLTKLLRNELGVEPLPETADEYHRLMIERR